MLNRGFGTSLFNIVSKAFVNFGKKLKSFKNFKTTLFNMVPKVLMNKSQIQTSFENSLFNIFILPKLNVNKKEFNTKPNVIGLM